MNHQVIKDTKVHKVQGVAAFSSCTFVFFVPWWFKKSCEQQTDH
jgi:hypothetical protein